MSSRRRATNERVEENTVQKEMEKLEDDVDKNGEG